MSYINNMKKLFRRGCESREKLMCAVMWAVVFAMLVPICDDGSAAAKRAQGLINGGNCYFVTQNMPDVCFEWRCTGLIELLKERIEKD